MLRERGGRSSGSLNGSATQELAASNKINETGACMAARALSLTCGYRSYTDAGICLKLE